MGLLANIPSPNAQQALFDLAWAPDLGKNVRKIAVEALRDSIRFHGILLTNSTHESSMICTILRIEEVILR